MYCILGIDVNLNNYLVQVADDFLSIGFKVFLTYMIDPPPVPVGVGLSTWKNLVTMYLNFWKQMIVLSVKPGLIERNDIKVFHLTVCNSFINLWR